MTSAEIIKSLGIKEIPSISDCHLRERVSTPINEADMFIRIVDRWEDWYGSTDKIREKVFEGRMPMMTDRRVRLFILKLTKKYTCSL